MKEPRIMTQDFRGKTITIFGATGFVGRYVVAELVKTGAFIRIITRHTASAYFLRSVGTPGQIKAVSARYDSYSAIEEAIKNSDAVINCIGVLHDGKKFKSFTHLHTDIPSWIAKACDSLSIPRFVHVSALGVDKSRSEYAITKFSGENLAYEAFPAVTILRPSVIFGAEDNFFNMFARLAKILPFLPLIGGGKTRFQPVYVGDVAKAVVHCLGDVRTIGKIYELGGPDILSFRQIYERLGHYMNRKICLVSLPWSIARIQAFFMSILPFPPLTNDQITSLQTDNIVSDNALGLKDLGLSPTPMDSIVPHYLSYATYSPRKG